METKYSFCFRLNLGELKNKSLNGLLSSSRSKNKREERHDKEVFHYIHTQSEWRKYDRWDFMNEVNYNQSKRGMLLLRRRKEIFEVNFTVCFVAQNNNTSSN